MFRHGRCFARVGDDYTLLFPECLWYPVAVPPVNVNAPLARQYDFTRYRLKVGDVGKRVAISQGEMEMSGDTTVFRNREPLPALSLTIGEYERRSIVLDSLTFELYHFSGHDFFMRDYRLREGSPAIDAGLDFPQGSSGYEDDFRGRMDSLRTSPFDIGAYEYFPLDE